MDNDHHRFMSLALAQGNLGRERGNSPIGSVIVRRGGIVGVGHNVALSSGDPTAHAEIQAIRDACHNLRRTDLSDCTCYTVMEPCPMCCWALVEVGIERVVLGARHQGMKRFAPPESTSYGDYAMEKLLAMTGRKFEIVTGVCTEECEENRRSWRPPTAS
ncbi:MAG: nucleoside deaminase [Anaerolineales bacterium]|nr:nucleoside deaminase [Anaerolineales bacterium]